MSNGIMFGGEYILRSDNFSFAIEETEKAYYIVTYGDSSVKKLEKSEMEVQSSPYLTWAADIWNPEQEQGNCFWSGLIESSSLPQINGKPIRRIVLIENELPYYFSIPPTPQYYLGEAKEAYGFDITPYVLPNGFTAGDFNCDGKIDATDASSVLSAYAKISTDKLAAEDLMGQATAADFNKDGKIDAGDASEILSRYAESSVGR